MKQSPAVYYRKQAQIRKLLGKQGKIKVLTKIQGRKRYSGIIVCEKRNITSEIISDYRKPQVGDKVVGVLRINKTNGKTGLIEYGVKFQLLEEVEY